MRKIHVLFLASWYPNKLKPQNGNFIQRHAEAVSEFCTVSVIHVRARIQKEKYTFDRTRNKKVEEFVCYYKKHNFNIPIISYFIKIIQKYQAFKKTYFRVLQTVEKVDIVHVNVMLPAGLFALYLKKKYKLPFIITEHWTKFQHSSTSKFSLLESVFIKKIGVKSSAICPVSENLKQSLIEFGIKANYQVIPNAVDSKIFFPEKFKKNQRLVKLLHISHLDDNHKNISGILNVIKTMSSERDNFLLTICGNRNLDKHKEYASKIGIPEKIIRFEGEKSSEEVARSMRNHDIFVLFSNYENLPCVISEAHMCGIPVISSDVGGISEMINAENGLLTQVGNEDDFIEKLSEMIQNYQNYSKELISNKAQNKYSFKIVGKSYFNLYNTVLKQPQTID